ncbi:MAG TPA: hypothetical protein VF003_08015 [Pseudonocardiaceae bacterium]
MADAVLYEGYLLYPYRRSSGKNRVRWQFGVLAPRRWVEATGVVGTSVAGSADAWHQQTECLLQAPDPAAIHVRLRFLQLQHRSVEARDSDDPDGDFHERDMLDVDGQRHLTFDEAVPREFDIAVQPGERSGDGHTATIAVTGGEDVETLGEAGRVVRRRWPISATVRLSVAPVDAPPDVGGGDHRARALQARRAGRADVLPTGQEGPTGR